jgi:hypothetical protein
MATVINLVADNFSIDSVSSLRVGGSVLQLVKPKTRINNTFSPHLADNIS